jgi:hypothetical protein
MSMVKKLFTKGAAHTDDARLIKENPGYHKISACCQQALSDKLGYAWADTCCI